jgi:hypothetical protein
MAKSDTSFRYFNSPPEVMPLGDDVGEVQLFLRNVEDLLFERGVGVG